MKIIHNIQQKIFFTSDTHFNHKNICRGTTAWRDSKGNIPIDATRDFKSLEEMNETILSNLNSAIKPDDILFHLGDWSFGGFEFIRTFREKINCKNIHLILGNNDRHIRRNKENIRELFTSVQDYLNIIVQVFPYTPLFRGEYEIILSHYPICSWENMNKGSIHLHGHVHLKEQTLEVRAMDVGVDGNALRPYSITDILNLLSDNKIGKYSIPNGHHSEEIKI